MKIKAGIGDGSDHAYNGRLGEIRRWYGCSTAEVALDKDVRGRPNPALIVGHCLLKLA